ncbi:MAG: hypothetical protein ACXABN_17035 [Candidatus Thorarchaeota archaeon]
MKGIILWDTVMKVGPSKCPYLELNLNPSVNLDVGRIDHEISFKIEIAAKEQSGLEFDLFLFPSQVISGAITTSDMIDRILSSRKTLVIQKSTADCFESVLITRADSYYLMLCNHDEVTERNIELKVVNKA